MYNLKTFREKVRELYRRSLPYEGTRRPTQRDLAEAIGLDPTELSNRLNGTKGALLTQRDIRAVVLALAEWEAISSQAEASELLALLDCPSFTAAEWQVPPLSDLAPNSATALLALPLGQPARNLPTYTSSFIGRKHDLDAVGRLLSDSRLLTLVGSGGIGKTRLALELARQLSGRFAAGVCLVELATLTDPSLVPQAVAKALGLGEQANQPVADMLVRYVSDKELLLVLDNCEHLLAAVTDLSYQLLRACPTLRILATSREKLNTEGEVVWRVPALSLPNPQTKVNPHTLPRYEAVRLFVERATAANPAFRLTYANAQAVREVCERLDGIPLALELAAARVSLLTAEQISTLLHDRFKLLTSGTRTVLPRQQTLAALIAWSYELLTPSEQQLFAQLAVFVGSCTLEAVLAVCPSAEGESTLDLLARLLDKSLLVNDQAGSAHYAMLESIREFALLHLSVAAAEELRDRHAAYYLSLAEQAEQELRGEQQTHWLMVLEQAHSNLRAALNHALSRKDGTLALRLAARLWRFWYVRGHLSEGRRWLEAALARSGEGASSLRGDALNGASNLAWSLGDYPAAARMIEESLNIHRAQDDQSGVAFALNSFGNVAASQGDFAKAYACYDEGLQIKRSLGDQQGIAASLNNLGTVAAKLGDPRRAQLLFTESLAIFQELHNKRGIATLLNNLGDMMAELGEYQTARQLQEQSLTLRQELGDRYGIAAVLQSCGTIAFLEQDYANARRYFLESLASRQELSDRYGLVYLLDSLANLAAAVGQSEQAVYLFAAAERLHARLGAPLPPSEQQRRDQMLAQARSNLTVASFNTAWLSGGLFDLEQAVRYALDHVGVFPPPAFAAA